METRCCPFCGGSRRLAVDWAYLPAGQTRLRTAVMTVRCKWCRGAGRIAAREPMPPG